MPNNNKAMVSPARKSLKYTSLLVLQQFWALLKGKSKNRAIASRHIYRFCYAVNVDVFGLAHIDRRQRITLSCNVNTKR